VTKELMQKVLEIKQDNKIIQVAWLSSAEYEKGSGIVELEFSPKLKPFMLGLKEFYTSYRLKNVLELKGKYSIRMYEILKSNEFKKVAEITIDELRKILKADKGSYLVYQNFRNRIILQAQKELNEKTDISFDFEEIKTGRKVTSLKFFIKTNKKVQKEKKSLDEISVDIDNNISKLVEIMEEQDVSYREAESIYKSGNADLIHIAEVYNHFKNKSADNFVGLMIDQVKPGAFNPPKKNNKNLVFNNFEQRDYDYADLERKLLGWD
jgi:plasmid replication initiation protein